MTGKFITALIAALVLGAMPALADTLPWISEENGPAICPAGQALVRLRCSGRYCDNIQASCTRYAEPPFVASSQPSYWTAWFSEEKSADVVDGSNFPRLADNYSVAIGLQCRGRYCDDIRLLMLPLRGPKVPTLDSKSEFPICRVSKPFSEENGGRSERPSAYIGKWTELIHRVGCSGSYCDNLRIEWCRAFLNN